MHLHIGTSGFAYKEWVGSFYPRGIGAKEMLAWYAGQFDTVEINNTFYRFPTAAGLNAWASQVPARFYFAIKVPQRITHIKRLQAINEDVTHLIETVSTLGSRLGALLFLLPPRMPLNVPALHELTNQFPPKLRIAFEFRDPRWLCEPVYRLLEERRCALCYNDAIMDAPIPTTDWGYVRLRREHYSEADLVGLAQKIDSQPWSEAFIFVKHESADSPLIAKCFSSIRR